MSEVYEVSGVVYGPLYKWTNYLKGYRYRWFMLQNGYLSYYRSQLESNRSCRSTVSVADAVVLESGPRTFTVTCETKTFNLRAASTSDRDKWTRSIRQAVDMALQDSSMSIMQLTVKDIRDRLVVVRERQNALRDSVRLVCNTRAQLGPDMARLRQITDHGSEVAVRGQTLMERAQKTADVSHLASQIAVEIVDEICLIDQQLEKLLQISDSNRTELERMIEQVGKQHQRMRGMVEKKGSVLRDCSPFVEPRSVNFFEPEVRQRGEQGADVDEYFDAVDDDDVIVTTLDLRQNGGRTEEGTKPRRIRSDSQSGSDSNTESDETDEELTPISSKIVIYSQKKTSDNDKEPTRTDSSSHLFPSTKKSKLPPDPVATLPSNSPDSASSRSINTRDVHSARRKTITARPNFSVNLWAILKQTLGKDLGKIALPVAFSEPLSFLQRLTEDLEYSELLDSVAGNTEIDRCLQMCHVAAFMVSAYANTGNRIYRPFNPLLGETYECDRTADLGWRSIAEKVIHHPTVIALYAEGTDWILWEEFSMTSAFRGNYLQVTPQGIAHLLFTKTGDHYTWKKVKTNVNNVIIGSLWIDHVGEVNIINHSTKDNCRLVFPGYSIRTKNKPRTVNGLVTNAAGVNQYVLTGTWDSKMEVAEVIRSTSVMSSKRLELRTGPPTAIWRRKIPPPELSKCYYFTQLAVELNEMEADIAPTDSRLRPDQRHLEDGQYDKADRIKVELEVKQRRSRAARETAAATLGHDHPDAQFLPRWFKLAPDPITGDMVHQYDGDYWKCRKTHDWSRCPDIFL